MYDVVIIGGGINGAGIARDAAGRGLSVLLVEQGDLAQGTSSASTKLIHGGLRYLEHYDFKLVAEALAERERLLKSAPHIIWPLDFIIPHEPHLRPRWLIRLGLCLYDWLGGWRQKLPASKGLNLKTHPAGEPLKDSYTHGFSYADCWVDDARLVALCALDAHEKGAHIRTRTRCTGLTPHAGYWDVQLNDKDSETVQARMVVNAAGPYVRKLLDANGLAQEGTLNMRYSKGSHILVPKIYEGDQAYLLQQPDGRIVFAIPYEDEFTLIGTTDVDYQGDPLAAQIDDDEVAYLCAAATRSFKLTVKPAHVVFTYSGVRGLLDSGDDNLAEVTRDYELDLEESFGAPILNIFGGKITTFRKLSQQATTLIAKRLKSKKGAWTKKAALPGGDMPRADFDAFLAAHIKRYPWINIALLQRWARLYGTRLTHIIKDAHTVADFGLHFGENIYEAEITYLMEAEWARTAEDILWRRTKLGLHLSDETKAAIEDYINRKAG